MRGTLLNLMIFQGRAIMSQHVMSEFDVAIINFPPGGSISEKGALKGYRKKIKNSSSCLL